MARSSRSQSPPTPPPPAQAGEKGALVFDWVGRRPLAAKIGIFAAISLVVHLLGFYLFQVVYPVTGRIEPVPSKIQYLDPELPAVAALMRQIDDRLVYLRPASAGSDVRVDLGDHSAQFRPSFADRPLGFRSLATPAPEAAAPQTPPPAAPPPGTSRP